MLLESSLITTLLGGITGLVGTVWSSYNKRKTMELEIRDRGAKRSHELAMVKAESDAMIAESKAAVEIVGARVAGEIEVAEAGAFTESIKAGQGNVFDAGYMDRLFAVTGRLRFLSIPAGVFLAVVLGIAEFIKSMARPGITAYQLGLSTWITIKAWQLLVRFHGDGLTAKMASGIVTDAVQVVLYLTVSSTTWWFGDRMASKGLAKSMSFRGV